MAQRPLLTYFFGLGWPWVGEFVGFIILLIGFPTQQSLVNCEHPTTVSAIRNCPDKQSQRRSLSRNGSISLATTSRRNRSAPELARLSCVWKRAITRHRKIKFDCPHPNQWRPSTRKRRRNKAAAMPHPKNSRNKLNKRSKEKFACPRPDGAKDAGRYVF